MGVQLRRGLCFFFVCLLFLSAATSAQEIPPRALITQPVVESQVTTLKGNTHPLARPEFDTGAAPPDLPLQRMLLVLKRSPEQDSALVRLLDSQQDKGSPGYHKWLTPDQFGARFGPSDQDLQVVTGWLQSHGFEIGRVSHGRTVIEFSGTEAQVEEALHTSIHRYSVNGEEHWANARDPQIPAALASVVAGVRLHNFPKKPQFALSQNRITAKLVPGAKPLFTSGTLHALTPADFYKIYNLQPLFGGAAKIAIVGRSNINLQDVIYFHYWMFDQAVSPQVIINGPDPGELGGGDETEAVLDTTWSGAVAPSAWVALVVSASTNASDGVDLSEEYIIDNNLADVMSESFGGCEANATSSEATAAASLAQQAAAQGITYLVSSGDSGAEGCDNPHSQTLATHSASVNLLAAVPDVVAVGGTMFNENGTPNKYWSSSNDPNTLGSALSYIPEDVWNESCTAAQCGSNAGIWAGGGGKSVFFQKPSWQSGVAGIAADNARDVPDISLSAAAHDPYLLCLDGSCIPDSQGFIHFVGISGTSVSAPAFAGIMATVGATTGSRQGQANYVLYRLAAGENLGQCNASSTSALPASSCVFNDVTKGNNAVPGETSYGTGAAQFQSGTGYDPATGLGSVNVTNLLSNWNSITFNSTSTSFSITPTSAVHGAPLNVAGTVMANTGTPSGTVWLVQTGYPNGNLVGDSTADLFPLSSQGSFSGATHILPGGTYQVSAHYPGDGTYGSSDSSPLIQLTIQPESTTTSFAVRTKDSNGNLVPFTTVPYGTPIYFTGHLGWGSGYGKPSAYILFWDNGSGIAQAFMNGGADVTTSPVTQIPAGNHSITAAYYGDNSFSTSSNLTPVDFSITKLTTSTGLSSQQTSQSLLLTATVNASGTASGPTGQVTFTSGNTVLGTAFLNSNSNPNSTSQATATFDASQVPAGQYSMVASYPGDTNYSASASAAVPLNLTADFAVGDRGTTSQTVTAGTTASYINDFGVTSFFGFSGSVSVSCSVPATGTTCTVDPNVYVLDNTTLQGIGSVSVTTTSRTLLGGVTKRNSNQHRSWPYWVFAVFPLCIVVGSSRRTLSLRARIFSFLLGLSLLAFGLSACGGGNGNGSGGGGGGGSTNPNGTAAGTYTVTVTATGGSVSHSMTYTLNVQ